MKINSDFKDLLRDFNAAGVRHLIVGGYAVMVYTEPRYTKDLDLWVEPVDANAEAVLRALAAFGAPTVGLTVTDLTEPEVFFQIGIDPVRVDILTSVKGLEFSVAWERRAMVDFGGVSAPVLCREDLLTAKIASGRAQDKRDARKLGRRS
jgi:predicted nucleotidyltransferase